ncbi:34486_t:CDS:2, partial [Racocetra persica]
SSGLTCLISANSIKKGLSWELGRLVVMLPLNKIKMNSNYLVSLVKKRDRVGRGPGFEGGQTRVTLRFPKRGGGFRPKKVYQIINLSELEKDERVANGQIIDFTREKSPVKILGGGNFTKKLLIKAAIFSRSAQEKITQTGGKFEAIKNLGTCLKNIKLKKGAIRQAAENSESDELTLSFSKVKEFFSISFSRRQIFFPERKTYPEIFSKPEGKYEGFTLEKEAKQQALTEIDNQLTENCVVPKISIC